MHAYLRLPSPFHGMLANYLLHSGSSCELVSPQKFEQASQHSSPPANKSIQALTSDTSEMNDRSPTSGKRSRLAESAYNSPYSHAGATGPQPNGDPLSALRANALSTLTAMGYDPATMVERGIV